MKSRSKKSLSKRIKITKTGKIKRRQAARSHLKRHKSRRLKTLLDINKADKKLRRLIYN